MHPREHQTVQLLWKIVWQFLKKLKIELSQDPGIVTYLKILVVAIAAMIFRGYMLLNKIKLYYNKFSKDLKIGLHQNL